jgi:ligand-binding sensor domain-containing protein
MRPNYGMLIFKQKLTALFAAVVSLCALVPGAGAQPNPQPKLQHVVNTDDIRALCRQGDDLWIGTNGGLLLFDVAHERLIDSGDMTNRLPSRSVRALACTGTRLYIGTDEGLAVSHRGNIEPFSDAKRGYSDRIRCIAFGWGDVIYLGTFGRGVVRLEDGSRRRFTTADSMMDDIVYAVYQPEEDTAYFGTALGLCALQEDTWIYYQAGYGLPRGDVTSLLPARGTEFYVLVAGKGVYLFGGKRARSLPLEPRFEEQDIAAIALDGDGNLWAAGRYGNISCFKRGEWVPFRESDPFIGETHWRSAYGDDEGAVYFGSSNGLIARIENDSLMRYKIRSAIPSNDVAAFCEDASGAMLFRSGGDLVKCDGEQFSILPMPGHLLSMAVSPDGALWCATRWGLFKREGSLVRDMTPELPGLQNYFTALAFDGGGNLWAGSYTGDVYRFDGRLWMPFGDEDGLPTAPVEKLVADGRGRVFALFPAAGVSVFDGLRWRSYPRSEFGDDSLRTLTRDERGVAVLLTDAAALSYSAAGTWEPLDVPKSDGPFTSMAFDRQGRVYLGTADSLVLAARGGVGVRRVQEGLHGTDIADLKVDSKGVLWVGSRYGGMVRAPVEELW